MSSFNKYNFNENLLKSIKDLNFNKPTPIQDKVIPEILSLDKDIIATAQTGTGKTAAFGLPIIQLTDNKNKDIECVILCPTRELCLQITKELNSYCSNMKYYNVISIYGGAKVDNQIKNLNLSQLPEYIIVEAKINQFANDVSEGMSKIKAFYSKNLPSNITTLNAKNNEKESDFLSHGNSSKNIYLLLQ